MERILLSLFICVIASSCTTAPSADIVKVRVLDSNFTETRTFESPNALNSFTNLWFNRESFKKVSPYNWTHKIDITTEAGGGGRWLYSTNGYYTLLSYQLKPMYKLKEPKLFNELIESP